jgi:hypothetical protein
MSNGGFLSRFIKIDKTKFNNAEQQRLLLVDILMLLLVITNLLFFLFYWSYGFATFRAVIDFIYKPFSDYYATQIAPNFEIIDLAFVSIFILELLIRWGLAIYRKTYEKWFFYPFVHWYDTLGCIPMSGAFKFLRLFRLFSLLYRFQRLGLVDFTATYVYKTFFKYLNILVEEVSDRVVINVIENVQKEVEKGNPLVDKIINDIIKPKEDLIVDFASKSISVAVTNTYYNRREELSAYLKGIVTKAVDENKEVKTIALIPGVGKPITQMLDSAIHNIAFNVIDNAMEDLAKNKDKEAIKYIIDSLLDTIQDNSNPQDIQLQKMAKNIVFESLELVKEQVAIKEWKAKEMEVKAANLQSHLSQHLHQLDEKE